MNLQRQCKRAWRFLLGITSFLCILGVQAVYANEVVLQFAGDVMLGGRWEAELSRDQYAYPFAEIAPMLRAADITLVNLEAPLTKGGTEFKGKKFRFRVSPVAAKALRSAGITTVTLANNHSMDFGAQGLRDTITTLSQTGIGHIGAGMTLAEARKALIYDIRGTKVAILGYSLTLPQEFWATQHQAGTAPLLEKLVQADIAAAQKQAEIIIVTVHWGEEGTTRLRPYQTRLAHMIIDAGADAVIGHHPHVLQGIETYKKGIIFYSLGNFVFGSKGRSGQNSLLVRLYFSHNRHEAELVPLSLSSPRHNFQPHILHGKPADALLSTVMQLPPGSSIKPLGSKIIFKKSAP